ncbi:MAG: IS1595 family transposase, partial [Gemmatimonadetes bacterium]|nr:IS1595 family transposase [Gemmatimonadota bacterium]
KVFCVLEGADQGAGHPDYALERKAELALDFVPLSFWTLSRAKVRSFSIVVTGGSPGLGWSLGLNDTLTSSLIHQRVPLRNGAGYVDRRVERLRTTPPPLRSADPASLACRTAVARSSPSPGRRVSHPSRVPLSGKRSPRPCGPSSTPNSLGSGSGRGSSLDGDYALDANGIAVLKRTLGVQYRTAWHLCHRIREAMGNDPFTGPTLVGIVEFDETMVGGKKRGKNWRDNKHWVAGAIERGGKVRLERIPDIRKGTIQDFVRRNISDEAEAIYTDELRSYVGIETPTRRHETVNHSAEEWVVGDVHTNSVEGVWSLFKRSIVGSFHKMSVKHMDRYLEELEWRFNNRDNPHIFRDALCRIMHTDPLQYQELIA